MADKPIQIQIRADVQYPKARHPFIIEESEYERKKIGWHELIERHSVTRLVMRRRIDDKLVVFWSWNMCDDCDWNCHGRVSIREDMAQQELCLTPKDGGR